MPQHDSISALNRLMGILCRSMPQYLAYARPHIPPGNEDVIETFAQIADDETVMSDRVSDLIQQSERLVETGEFRIEFTSLHDLDVDYLVEQAIEYQKLDLGTHELLVDDLRFAPAARSLAEEALGMAKGHLESLEELVQEHAAAPADSA